MMYDYYSNLIWMNYSDSCGDTPGRDCVAIQIHVENLRVDVYPSLFTYGIRFNGQDFVQRYNGPELPERPSDLSVDLTITKYDVVNKIMEGTLQGKFCKFQNPSAQVFDLSGEFRVYIFTN